MKDEQTNFTYLFINYSDRYFSCYTKDTWKILLSSISPPAVSPLSLYFICAGMQERFVSIVFYC